MVDVLVTMPFGEALLARMRAVSGDVSVASAAPDRADYSRTDVLYAIAPPRDLDRAPKLKWVQLHMAGVDSIHDHPLYARQDITLTTTSGVHASTVAEYALTVMLALAHRVPRMVEWKDRGVWPPDAERWPLFVPTEIRGATLGIIGYGSIGRELARMAKAAFGMRVIACKKTPGERKDTGYCLPGMGDPDGVFPDEWLPVPELPRLLASADVVVMCAPLTPDTRGMIGAPELARMKPSAVFINVGRGASVDEAALAEALAAGRIAGAAVDVFSAEPPPPRHPLYAAPNAIVSPHVSGFLASYDDRCTDLFAENLRRYLAGTPLVNVVDRARGY